MPTPQEVACQFIPAFFERLASNPADVAEMYDSNSSLTIVDFVYGTTEVRNGDVPRAVEQWSQILQGHEMCVENYSAVPLYGGISVYVTMFADSKTTRHYFQFVNILESYNTGAYGSEAYFIRHQIVMRLGSAEKEQPEPEVKPQPEPKLEVSSEPVEATVAPACPSAVEEEGNKEQSQPKKDATMEVPEAAAEVTSEEKTAADEPAAAAPVQRQPPATSSKPKSWAILASAQPKGEQRQPLRVVVPENGGNADAAEVNAPVKPTQTEQRHVASSSAAAAGAQKSSAKAPRPPAAPIGDRLMFNIDYAVSDEEIKTAFGPLAAHIVSLRNNSANGHVFLDFSDKENIMDVLKANPPTGRYTQDSCEHLPSEDEAVGKGVGSTPFTKSME
ncbi:putative RNA-binding protein [Trypanosoma rangeli]|uniref:Putative RNA-binding protein n=1 Tax=Trypanosoma rangeli TaxID=5698 RepID=A0A3R7N1J6_TRYRA|nr:putative RNA-binding protein [Trypanosoma rangeli]RNF11319.1 putative RNA-binding protein [Trypanosoma rangeli]|eukprot:RNF11319.1 putative RNA-binding protein [Trypanosoma rangeli]